MTASISSRVCPPLLIRFQFQNVFGLEVGDHPAWSIQMSLEGRVI